MLRQEGLEARRNCWARSCCTQWPAPSISSTPSNFVHDRFMCRGCRHADTHPNHSARDEQRRHVDGAAANNCVSADSRGTRRPDTTAGPWKRYPVLGRVDLQFRP